MQRKILLLITDLEIGGTPTVVRELAIRLNDPPTVEIEVACLKSWGPVADQLRDAAIPVTAFELKRPWQLPAGVRRLRELVRERKIDTIVSFLIHANTLSAMAVHDLPGVRLIQSVQTTALAEVALVAAGSDRKGGGADHRAVEQRRDSAKKSERRVAREVTVVPNAVDPAAFTRQAVFAASKVRAGFIGRMDPVKRLDIAIAAVGSIEEFPIELVMFGDGQQRVPWETWQERRFPDPADVKFHWMGKAKTPQQALAQMDLLLLPSIGEGFGLVLIEAMAAGVPVIASGAGGVNDVVQHEHNGLLVPMGGDEAKGFAEAIRRVKDDAPLRERLIENGLATVREKFSWDTVLAQYRRVLKLSPLPPGED